jgi:hypothetical protein
VLYVGGLDVDDRWASESRPLRSMTCKIYSSAGLDFEVLVDGLVACVCVLLSYR